MTLQPRHEKIVPLIGRGLSYGRVAEKTGLSRDTVRQYTRQIARRLPHDPYGDLTPKVAVMRWAIQNGYTS